MQRLKKIGTITPKHSKDIAHSRLGIGFEKLDRDAFDPEKAYDKIAALGVKWARIQSGWQKTEKERGVYDFAWLDAIVDNLISRGLIPWMCLCYGNELYTPEAAEVFGAVGCPPIHTEEERQAWHSYVKACAAHYKGRIEYFEVWNEPDGGWCWKYGPNPVELGEFTVATAKAVKEGNPDAKVIGGSVCSKNLCYVQQALDTGMGEAVDAFTFHEYTPNETSIPETVAAYGALCRKYNPNIEIIQGESGSQSKSGGHGALWSQGWNEDKQARQLARHTMIDLTTPVKFTSYFSCMDMIEALNGKKGDKQSWLDFGYFGVLGAQFDENGFPIGTYEPKPSYRALQTIASIFAEDFEVCDLPIFTWRFNSPWIGGIDCQEASMISCGFRKPNGSEAYVYWNSTNLHTTRFESTASYQIANDHCDDIKLVNLLDGSVYEIGPDILERTSDKSVTLKNVPITDYPLLITFGDFIEFERL
ncbi:MAG: beta-galactosidase [Lachnospiraceae bacterium]|nr:beta-galactosidase [Lachnospiraceae bacterium]